MVAVDVELCGHAVFAAASGVHGAAGLLRAEGRLGQAVHARYAVFELILAPLRDLAAELRLGEQLAAEGHGVALAVADDAVDVVGMAQRAAGRDRDADAVFHDLGIGDLPALFPVAVGAHTGQARHHAAAVDGDEAHAVLLEQRRRAAEPGHAGLAVVAVRAVHLRHDLHVGAGLPDAVDDLEREAHGVVHVLRAVFVRAVVEVRAVELLGQVVVRHVPLDGVGAGLGTAVKESQEHRDGFLLPTVIFRHGGNTFQVLTFLEDVLVTNPDNRTAVILGHARAVTLPRQDVTVRPDPPVAHKEEHGLVLRVPLHKAVIKGGVIQVAAPGGEVIPQGGDGTDDFPLDYLELRLDILARYQKERTTQVGVVAVQAITVRLVV